MNTEVVVPAVSYCFEHVRSWGKLPGCLSGIMVAVQAKVWEDHFAKWYVPRRIRQADTRQRIRDPDTWIRTPDMRMHGMPDTCTHIRLPDTLIRMPDMPSWRIRHPDMRIRSPDPTSADL